MRKLLSTTALAATLAFGGAAWAQTGGTTGGTPGGAGAPSASGSSSSNDAGGANRPTQAPSIAPLGQQTGRMMDESQVRDMLSKQGFSNVENVTRSGNNYHARAMQNGRPLDLTVDANTGAVHSQAAAR
jgi:hypothetical protein